MCLVVPIVEPLTCDQSMLWSSFSSTNPTEHTLSPRTRYSPSFTSAEGSGSSCSRMTLSTASVRTCRRTRVSLPARHAEAHAVTGLDEAEKGRMSVPGWSTDRLRLGCRPRFSSRPSRSALFLERESWELARNRWRSGWNRPFTVQVASESGHGQTMDGAVTGRTVVPRGLGRVKGSGSSGCGSTLLRRVLVAMVGWRRSFSPAT